MLFVLYGQQKSASTYVARLIRAACEAVGCDQDVLRERHMTGDLAENRTYWKSDLVAAATVADRLAPGEAITIKTHRRYRSAYARALDRPDIRVFISYRHPGDAALSAFEAGEKARRTDPGKFPFFASLTTHRKAIDWMSDIVAKNTIPWLKSGLGPSFNFDEVTADPGQLLKITAASLCHPVETFRADGQIQDLMSRKATVYNFNRGLSGRHREIFSDQDLAHLQMRCGPFIRFCQGEATPQDL